MKSVRVLLALLFLSGCGDSGLHPVPGEGNSDTSGIPWVTPVSDGVNVERVLFVSDAVGTEVSFHIYLPHVYRFLPQQRFPVVYWLHGMGGGVVGVPAVSTRFHRAILEGEIPPLIVVFPNGLPEGMWVNSLDGRQPIESIVMNELIPLVDSRYRTRGAAERIIDGFSMGGYGAARLGLRYPEEFAAISMVGAGPLQEDLLAEGPLLPRAQRERILAEVFGGSLDYFQQESPRRLAEEGAEGMPPGPGIPLRILVGAEDPLVEANREFRDLLTTLEIPHTYTEVAGVPHSVPALLDVMGSAFWAYYRGILNP